MVGERNNPLPLSPILLHQSSYLQVVPESNQWERELHFTRLRHPIRRPVSDSTAVPLTSWEPVPPSRAGQLRTLGSTPCSAGLRALGAVHGGGAPASAQAPREGLSRAARPSRPPRPQDPRSGAACPKRRVPSAGKERRRRQQWEP